MSAALATVVPLAADIERLLAVGDLARLTPEQRVQHYGAVCASVGLNPLTRPFEYLTLNGKTVLYARRDATDQLRRQHGVSIIITARELEGGVYAVTARATTPDGRTDESIGAVPVDGLRGEQLANARMKAETKAKRRVTLSICGLGFTDESEVESIPDARRVTIDHETGEILEPPKALPRKPSAQAQPAADKADAVIGDELGAIMLALTDAADKAALDDVLGRIGALKALCPNLPKGRLDELRAAYKAKKAALGEVAA